MRKEKLRIWNVESDSYISLPFVQSNNSDGDMDVNEVHFLPSSHQMKSVVCREEEEASGAS